MLNFKEADMPAEEPPKEEFKPTEEELAAGQAEWGVKYNDECLKFEKEWETIAKAVQEQQMVYLESELGDLQKAKVDMLVDKVMDLNLFEMRYYVAKMEIKAAKSTGLSPMKMNLDWPSVKKDATGSWPPANPNWFKQ